MPLGVSWLLLEATAQACCGSAMRVWWASLCVGLVACSTVSLMGTYTDSGEKMVYEFESNGRLAVLSLGAKVAMRYQVSGNRVQIITLQGQPALLLNLMPDGSLRSGALVLQKKS
jgi:hypothetical protein